LILARYWARWPDEDAGDVEEEEAADGEDIAAAADDDECEDEGEGEEEAFRAYPEAEGGDMYEFASEFGSADARLREEEDSADEEEEAGADSESSFGVDAAASSNIDCARPSCRPRSGVARTGVATFTSS
jgi:hypothetical protein